MMTFTKENLHLREGFKTYRKSGAAAWADWAALVRG